MPSLTRLDGEKPLIGQTQSKIFFQPNIDTDDKVILISFQVLGPVDLHYLHSSKGHMDHRARRIFAGPVASLTRRGWIEVVDQPNPIDFTST